MNKFYYISLIKQLYRKGSIIKTPSDKTIDRWKIWGQSLIKKGAEIRIETEIKRYDFFILFNIDFYKIGQNKLSVG